MKLGVIMEPLAAVNINKNTSFALLLEAQKRDYEIYHMQDNAIYLEDGKVYAKCQIIKVDDNVNKWHEVKSEKMVDLASLDVILLRKDPPFDNSYLYLTQLLDLVENTGVLVLNKPSTVRSFNEKLSTALFADIAPHTLVTSSIVQLREFLQKHQNIIVKPLDVMGGSSIFKVAVDDLNANVIFETITNMEQHKVMAQKYIPDIKHSGDKRIIIIDGEPLPYALARIPSADDFRGNLVRGAHAQGQKLSADDRKICQRLSPTLQSSGLLFVGIDVIGKYLTEINVTSPTGVRELDREFDLNICGLLFDKIARK